MKIEWVTGVPYLILNEGDTLVINYDRWMDLSKDEKKFLLEHEKLHSAMYDEMQRRNEQ